MQEQQKKVLFLGINTGSVPSWERQLELMRLHQKQGHEIYVMGCRGDLESCYSNPKHNIPRCMYCKLRFRNGVQRLGIPKTHIVFLNRALRNVQLIDDYKFNTRDDLRKFNLWGVDFGEAVESLLISEFHEPDFEVKNHVSYIKRKLRTSLLVYESVCDFFQLVSIDCVYVFNGRVHDVRPIVRLCQQRNVDFYVHEDGPDGSGNIDHYQICHEVLPHDLRFLKNEIFITWERGERNRWNVATRWFIKNRHNAPKNWSFNLEGLNREQIYSPNKVFSKIILICISSSFEYKAFEDWGKLFYQSDAGAVDCIARDLQEYLFIVRVHPNLKNIYNSQIRAFLHINAQQRPNLRFIWADEKISTYYLLDICDVVVTFLSTVGVEACFWHKPAILLGSAPYEDLNCCYQPKNHQELIDLLRQDLSPKPVAGALKYGYWRATGGIKYKYFQPSSRYEGVFEGKPIVPKYSFQKIPFWFVRGWEKIRNKTKNIFGSTGKL